MVPLIKGLARFVAWLPRPRALALGRGLGTLFRLAARKQATTAAANLRRCFPDKSPAERRALARAVFHHAGMNLAETLRWLGGADDRLDDLVDASGAGGLAEGRLRGKGVLALCGHIGNFDLMGLWAAPHYPLTIISKDIKNEGLNAMWMEARRRSGIKIVPAHNSYRACLHVLKRNEYLGFILDQNMARDEGIFVDFFGQPACTTPGLAVMSAHSGAPVVPVYLVRQPDGRHAIHTLPPIDPPPDRKPESIARATQHYTNVLEDVIRQHPEQWIWMHRRWRTQPTAIEQSAPPGVQGSKI